MMCHIKKRIKNGVAIVNQRNDVITIYKHCFIRIWHERLKKLQYSPSMYVLTVTCIYIYINTFAVVTNVFYCITKKPYKC